LGYVLFFVSAIFTLVTARPAAGQTCGTGGNVCVQTWQADNGVTDISCTGCAYRTGENLQESTITYSTIKNDNFGVHCSVQVNGPVYAQPLVISLRWSSTGSSLADGSPVR
jgi:hypothetical protein